jgi:2'-5' RNA ligase
MYSTRPETHRMYYVAIVCPKKIDEKVFQLKEWMRKQFGCMVALKSPGHITLIPPFWMDEERENELIETLQQFKSNDKPEIQLKDFSHFGDRVLFIHVNENEQLTQLKEQTESHFLENFNGVIKKDERPFNPHVTIANRDVSPGTFVKAWAHFSKENFEEHFIADTVSVLKLNSGRWDVITERKI